VFGLDGRELTDAATSRDHWLHYLCRKAPGGGAPVSWVR
jgi:hypothetical protein